MVASLWPILGRNGFAARGCVSSHRPVPGRIPCLESAIAFTFRRTEQRVASVIYALTRCDLENPKTTTLGV